MIGSSSSGKWVRAIGTRLNNLASLLTLTIAEVTGMTVAWVTFGAGLARIVPGAVRQVAEALVRETMFTCLAQEILPAPDLRPLFND